jgi:SAM-dependent methyltransferase
MSQESACPLCAGKTSALCQPHPQRAIVSDGRVLPRALKKLSCLNCGAASRAPGMLDSDFRAIYGSGYQLAAAAPKSDTARARAYAQWIRSEATAPRSIFEVGCGSGALLREFSAIWPEADCLGLDPSVPRPERSDSKFRLERGFIEDVPHDIGQFDLIVAVNVIEHLSNPTRFLASLRPRLTPGGKIVIVCPAAEPPNSELLFFDHLYTFTTNSLGHAVADTSLLMRTQSLAPPAIGDFQMVTFDNAETGSTLPLHQGSFSGLCSQRQSYLEGWYRLDQALLDRLQAVPRLVGFGGGQTAALLRAYAPRTWARIETILLDDVNEAWQLGVPVASYGNAVQNLETTAILIMTSPRVQGAIADRLRRDGLQSIRWDDLITN